MYQTNILYAGLLVLLLGVGSVNMAQAQRSWAIGIKGGTTGIGGEVITSLGSYFNARLTGSHISGSYKGIYDGDEPSIDYNVNGGITSIGGVVDFFPFKRALKLTAGVFYHDFAVDGGAVPSESYFMDDKEFTPEKLGSLAAKIHYKSKIVPYAGLGFGNPVASGTRIKLNIEVGAMYTDSPQVDLQGEGMIGPTASQGQDFEDGLTDFQFYPVLNLGLTFGF